MTWTIPNILTVIRLAAAPGVAVMFLYFDRPWADWFALVLFISAALTDFIDGYLARAWGQESKFGAMLDPIADKAMVVIALMVITAHSGLIPWLILPATMILFREVFVSGLREFLGARAGLLKVTRLAKWKTTLQMVAIAVLFLGTGLQFLHLETQARMDPAAYEAALLAGPSDGNSLWLMAQVGRLAEIAGIVLIWLAAALTLVTGWDYFSKALPYLKDEPSPGGLPRDGGAG